MLIRNIDHETLFIYSVPVCSTIFRHLFSPEREKVMKCKD